jgi:hypothetical protein
VTDSLAAPRGAARFFLAFVAAVMLGSCGSGAVTPQVVDPDQIRILPSTATLYSGLPTQFVITGGTNQYIVTSSNQAAVQVSGAISGNTLVIVPNNVTTDTQVTLTVRDTGATPTVTATLTVKPNPVNNDVTITPTGTQAAACSPAVCAGGDALVEATISQGGIPLAARTVRMSVVSGDFRFIVSPPGQGEVLGTSIDVVSDEVGKVSARLRALNDAPNQTALVEVQDLGTLAFRRASFLIAQNSGAGNAFLVTPTAITFSGPFTGQCADNVSAVVYVFGGSPPYTIANTGGDAFIVSNDVVFQSGGSFAVHARGLCTTATGFPILVRDTAGRSATVTVANVEGTAALSPVVATPDQLTLASCSTSASATISGGRGFGSYFVNSGSNSLLTSISGGTLTVRRRIPSPDPGASSIDVSVSDGASSTTVTVSGAGLVGPCDNSTLAVSTNTVTLASCGPVSITVSGGNGPGSYVASSNNSSVTVTQPVPGTFDISRTAGSAGFAPPATVTISDGTASRLVTVQASGTGPGSGTGACP